MSKSVQSTPVRPVGEASQPLNVTVPGTAVRSTENSNQLDVLVLDHNVLAVRLRTAIGFEICGYASIVPGSAPQRRVTACQFVRAAVQNARAVANFSRAGAAGVVAAHLLLARLRASTVALGLRGRRIP